MSDSPGRLARILADHGEKLLRYCGVSVVNVVVGQSILAVGLEVLDMGGVSAQFAAAMISAVPAYILSRQWVWKQDGRVSFRSEVLPFWIMAVVGLVFAVSMIAIVERSTSSTIAIMATSLGSYGVVWVAKYVFLDKVMWAALHHHDDPAPATAETV
ncbi:MAG: hypothetical protein GY773_12780 [Actinomycetia bacterium]|nr:hypothetical protein [Actinomycetes bacterium]